jgi:hypothetical protein
MEPHSFHCNHHEDDTISIVVPLYNEADILPHQYAVDLLLQRKTDTAIAVSNSVKEFMHKGRSIPKSKIKIIPNGIEINKSEKISEDEIGAKEKN